MNVMEVIKFLGANYDMILQSIIMIFGALGVICESINRMLPNVGDESALSKVGKTIAKIGGYVQKFMDFIKVPNTKSK